MTSLLLSKGYTVHGLIRPCTRGTPSVLGTFLPHERFHLHHGDILDSVCLREILGAHAFHEIYHFAAQSHVSTSFSMPLYTSDVVAMGTLRLSEAIRVSGLQKSVKVYNVSRKRPGVTRNAHST